MRELFIWQTYQVFQLDGPVILDSSSDGLLTRMHLWFLKLVECDTRESAAQNFAFLRSLQQFLLTIQTVQVKMIPLRFRASEASREQTILRLRYTFRSLLCS